MTCFDKRARRIATLALVAWLLLASRVSLAETPATTGAPGAAEGAEIEQLFSAAEQAEERLDYEEAAILWTELIARPDLSAERRIAANFNAGRIARIRGQDLEARMHFTHVLQRVPDFRVPPDTPPKVLHLFELVRQEHQSAPARDEVATPPPAEPPPAEDDGLSPLWIAAGATGALGAALVAAGGLAGWLSYGTEQAALETSVQTDRVALYDERDVYALMANIGYAAGGIGLVVCAGLAAVTLIEEDE
jgi:hypothetical protein